MRRRILYLLMSAVLIIPSYPGSKKIWERDMVVSGIKIKLIQYQSKDSAVKIVDFYIDKLVKAGWFLNHRSDDPPVVFLTGVDYSGLTIRCSDILKRGINDIVIVHSSPISQDIINAMTMDIDFPGEDIASIPRYPSSIRKYYYQMDKAINTIYESKQGCLDCVLRFYRAEMTARGWKLLTETKTTVGEPLKTKGMPEEIKAYMPEDIEGYIQELTKYPMVVFAFESKKATAQLSVIKKDNSIFININYFPRR